MRSSAVKMLCFESASILLLCFLLCIAGDSSAGHSGISLPASSTDSPLFTSSLSSSLVRQQPLIHVQHSLEGASQGWRREADESKFSGVISRAYSSSKALWTRGAEKFSRWLFATARQLEASSTTRPTSKQVEAETAVGDGEPTRTIHSVSRASNSSASADPLPKGLLVLTHAVPSNRSRRGVFPILPDSYVDRQSYFSPTETCRQKNLIRVLRPPGCLPRTVRSSACQGTCHSRAVPQWSMERQEMRLVSYCTCCKPHRLTYRRVRFRCPGRTQRQLVFFQGVAGDCACRPCSDGNPELQQPYDY